MKRLYSSQSLVVDYHDVDSAMPINVTFSSHVPNHDGQVGVGAWQRQIERENRNGIFFISKANHWFNVPDIVDAIEAAMEVRQLYGAAVGIGASMGGHAAIRLSAALNLAGVAAISPQFCVSEERASYERRWRADVKQITHWDDPISPQKTAGSIVVIFDDKHQVDRQHAEAIGSVISIKAVPLSYTGHSSVGGLGDIGAMNEIFNVTDAESAEMVTRRIQNAYNRNKEKAATVLINKAKSLSPDDRAEFLLSVSQVVGMQRNRDAFRQFLEQSSGRGPSTVKSPL